jgi:hypothetical protein
MNGTGTETPSEPENAESGARTPPRSLLVALFLGGIVLPGVVSYVLNAAEFTLISDVVWVSGYAIAVFLAWYGWIRPLDITGPD